MKHFGIFIADLESERFLSASNDQIATWLFLHAFCSKQLNGGTIADARALPHRFWSRHGIEKSILDQPSPLWSWSSENLSVTPYDIDGQTLYEKKVNGGKIGMAKRWGGSGNKSPNKSLNRPNLTLPNLTRPDQTEPDASSCDEGNLFGEKPAPNQSKARGTLAELQAYAVKIGLPESDGESMFLRFEENGWMNGRSKVKCWQSSMKRWKHEGWHPSQKAPSRPESHDALVAHAKSQGIAEPVATAWWDRRQALGWRINGQPIAEWKADLIGFVEAWHRNEAKK
jgi:hypothetical protein